MAQSSRRQVYYIRLVPVTLPSTPGDGSAPSIGAEVEARATCIAIGYPGWVLQPPLKPISTNCGTTCHWDRPSVAKYHTLIRSCVSFKFKFNCLNFKTSCFIVRAKKYIFLKKIKFHPLSTYKYTPPKTILQKIKKIIKNQISGFILCIIF
jgi:hypothetical protein